METVVKRLLERGRTLGFRPKLLLLDRGFYSVGVLRYLQAARVPFLMPAVVRGRKPSPGRPARGTRALASRKKGGWSTHTLRESPGKRTATVRIAIYCGNYCGQWKRHGRYTWLYAFWGLRPGSLRWVAETYRTRFGIESSYRQMKEARARTCSRRPEIRLLLVGVSLILRNVWVWYHWEVLSTPHRGGRRLRLERMRLHHMLQWIVHVLVAELGACDGAWTERDVEAAVAASG